MGTSIELISAKASDAEAMATLRVEAMRESLEAIGRFDHERARQRLLSGFEPRYSQHIIFEDKRIGFVALRPDAEGLSLDHLYIQPEFQSLGLGSKVLKWVFDSADHQGKTLRVGALTQSRANQFYLRHGFVLVEETALDNYYVRMPRRPADPQMNPMDRHSDRMAASSSVHSTAQKTCIAPITSDNPSIEQMEARVARFRNLKPTDDYVDSAIPGCERTTLRVLGSLPQAPLAAEGFHMSIVHCEPGKSAPLHNHLTQEVFLALSGRWEIFWGPTGQRSVVLEQWDTVSVPPGVSRGFRNIGIEAAYLLGMASGKDPGMINWPEQVRTAALAVGVELPGS